MGSFVVFYRWGNRDLMRAFDIPEQLGWESNEGGSTGEHSEIFSDAEEFIGPAEQYENAKAAIVEFCHAMKQRGALAHFAIRRVYEAIHNLDWNSPEVVAD